MISFLSCSWLPCIELLCPILWWISFFVCYTRDVKKKGSATHSCFPFYHLHIVCKAVSRKAGPAEQGWPSCAQICFDLIGNVVPSQSGLLSQSAKQKQNKTPTCNEQAVPSWTETCGLTHLISTPLIADITPPYPLCAYNTITEEPTWWKSCQSPPP